MERVVKRVEYETREVLIIETRNEPDLLASIDVALQRNWEEYARGRVPGTNGYAVWLHRDKPQLSASTAPTPEPSI